MPNMEKALIGQTNSQFKYENVHSGKNGLFGSEPLYSELRLT